MYCKLRFAQSLTEEPNGPRHAKFEQHARPILVNIEKLELKKILSDAVEGWSLPCLQFPLKQC